MKRVLLVEDDASLRASMAEILTDSGYAVCSAGDGQAALAQARTWRPHVILLDLMMPTMNGWQFRAAQRQAPALARVPVIVISAFSDRAPQASLGEIAALLPKPFSAAALLEGIRRHTGQGG